MKKKNKRFDIEEKLVDDILDKDDEDDCNRELFLTTAVDNDSMKELIEEIVKINKDDDKQDKKLKNFVRKPITIFINSPGGGVYDCLGLLDVIHNSKTPIHTQIIGIAASAAGIIFIAGHKRFMGKYGTILYHNIKSWNYGTSHDFKIEVKEIERIQKLIDRLFLDNSTLTQSMLDTWKTSKTDKYIDYKMAKRYKMISDEKEL